MRITTEKIYQNFFRGKFTLDMVMKVSQVVDVRIEFGIF
jgi:hypothetical protein